MKIEFTPLSEHRKVNPYRKRSTGNLCYVYNVIGTKEELAEYKKANPLAVTDEKTGHILKISTDFVGKEAELGKSVKADGTVSFYVDTKDLEMFANLEKKWGPTIAAQKMAELKG